MADKYSERLAADPEKCTADVEDAADITVNITVDGASAIPQKKIGNEEDSQVNLYDKNESNKSNKENASKTIEKTLSNQIKQTATDITNNKNDPLMPHLNKYLKTYIDNLTTPSLSTPVGKYTAKKLLTDESENTNRTRMGHVSLSAVTIRSKELAISRSPLDDKLIHNNQ